MILTKDKIKTKTNHKINRRLKKSILLAFMVPFIFTTGWELSVVASQVVQVNNTIEYKTNYYSQLENYKTFKTKIDEVPYTDSQFKEDLKLFGNMYMQNGNITFNQLFSEDKGLNSMLQMKYRYTDANKTLESIAYNVKGLSTSEAMKNKSVVDLYEDLKINNKKDLDKFRNSALMLSSNASEFGSVYAGNVIFNNLGKLLTENGYDPNTYFIDQNVWKEYRQIKNRTQANDFYENKIIGNYNKQIEQMKVYYRNGETKKLREIFKIGHSFSQLLIDIPLESKNRDTYSGGDSISTYNNYITFDQIVQLSQKYDDLRGTETKEKDKYYNDSLGIKF